MEIYYFESPHRQITENFSATVTKVHDGDTITLRWSERDFEFPLRLSNIAAPEIGGKKGEETGGKESQEFLEKRILGKTVDIVINPNNRVEKWGRLLGNVIETGIDVGEESILLGFSQTWENVGEGNIPEVKF